MDWKIRALVLADDTDMSWRAIAREVGEPKSTVSDFLRVATGKGEGVRILLYDIETMYLTVRAWRTGKTYVNYDDILKSGCMISWTAKWLGSARVIQDALFLHGGYEAGTRDDRAVCESLHALMSQADIVVGHNSKGFDTKYVKERFIMHGLSPLPPFKEYDTYRAARRHLRGDESLKLKALAKRFGLTEKLDTGAGMELWERVDAGDMEAWQHMMTYNAGDVFTLEELYLKIRPYDHRHPNVSLYEDVNVRLRCTVCGSENMTEPEEVYQYTNVNRYVVHRCGDCGAYSRERRGDKTTLERENVLAPSR